jgi:hypothetical protein
MRYILEVNEHVRPEALQVLLEREIGPPAKDTIVTAGQQLIEQGRQEGLQEVLLHLGSPAVSTWVRNGPLARMMSTGGVSYTKASTALASAM